MERTPRQQSNHDYWEQAQRLDPLDISARAEMLAGQQKTAEAYAEFERSLTEVAERYGNPSPQLELTRRRFIAFCWSQRDYERIYALSLSNLRCKEARYGNLHPSLQLRLGDLSGACYYLGRHAEAENFARQMLAIALMQRYPWKDRGDHALNYVATGLALRGDHAGAIDYLRQALVWAEKAAGARDDIRAYAVKLADAYAALGRFKEASAVLKKHEPSKDAFALRNPVRVLHYYWRWFNLDMRFRKPRDRTFNALIAACVPVMPTVGLRADNRELFFFFEMMKARLLKFRDKKQEAKQAYARILEVLEDGPPLSGGKLSWAYADLAELWHGPPYRSEEERAYLRRALDCLEAAGITQGPFYARLLSRFGRWHEVLERETYLACHRKAVAALKEGEDAVLLANLHWHIGMGEVSRFGYGWLRNVQLEWKSLPPGRPPKLEIEIFVRWQGLFRQIHRRHLVSLGPRHPDTLRILDFINTYLS